MYHTPHLPLPYYHPHQLYREDEFGAWLEQKGEVPVVFEDVLVEGGCYYGGTGQLHNVEELLHQHQQQQQQQHVTPAAPPAVATHPGDAVLLKEFEYVLQGGVAPPTPPRSPPSHHDLLTIIQELDGSGGNELDELVASRVESFYPESVVGSVGYPSPRSSGESSCGGSSPPTETSDSDPEWCAPPSRGGGSGGPLRRRRGGAAPADERRRRKKEQNKNAATRYRMKKKAEAEGIKDEEKELKERNTQLHDQVTDIAREIRYLKGLMRDVFRAKGLIS